MRVWGGGGNGELASLITGGCAVGRLRQTRVVLAGASRHLSVALWATFMLWGLALRASQAAKAVRNKRRRVEELLMSGVEGKEGAVEEAQAALGEAENRARVAIGQALREGVPSRDWLQPLAPPADIPTESQLSVILQDMVRGVRRVPRYA